MREQALTLWSPLGLTAVVPSVMAAADACPYADQVHRMIANASAAMEQSRRARIAGLMLNGREVKGISDVTIDTGQNQ